MAMALNKFATKAFLCNLEKWCMIRDCYEGQDAVKAKGEDYLPKLTAQSDADYKNYLFRALFFPITGKTATTLVGMATHKPPEVKHPSELDPYFEDANGSYEFTEFYVNLLLELVLMGRYGVLLDAPPVSSQRLVIAPYIAENIVRFEPDRNGNMELLLRECYEEPIPNTQYETKTKVRYRRCFMADGVYNQEVLDDDLKVITPAIAPEFMGSTINFIPFIPFGASGIHYEVDRAPMYDLATINMSHYLTSADLEWGRHIVGLPTPVVSGVDAGTNLKIGGTAAWILPDVNAKASFLEFQGQGLQSLEKALEEKVSLMASASARLIDHNSGKNGSEAETAVRLRYMSEAASLIHIITSAENGLNYMYNMVARLHKAQETVEITFSREVLGITLSFSDLKVLMDGWMNGSVSDEDLLYNMRRLEAVDPKRTDAQALEAMKAAKAKAEAAAKAKAIQPTAAA